MPPKYKKANAVINATTQGSQFHLALLTGFNPGIFAMLGTKAPHFLQNLSSGLNSAPHFGQFDIGRSIPLYANSGAIMKIKYNVTNTNMNTMGITISLARKDGTSQ